MEDKENEETDTSSDYNSDSVNYITIQELESALKGLQNKKATPNRGSI